MQISGISSAETSRNVTVQPSATLWRERFALSGRSHAFDARIDAARGDLADLRLANRLFAPHYAAAVRRCARVATPVTGSDKSIASELLAGEAFEVLELAGTQAWGVCTVDGSVGHVDAAALVPAIEATHIVCTRDADGLPMGSRIAGEEQDDRLVFAGGSVALDAVRPIAAPVADFVALAEALAGVPTIPGGRSGAGVDCTGLVFVTLSLAGIPAPRFLDLQAGHLGHAINDGAPMLRGDLIFFDDHVAIAADGSHVIHAAADAVTREPLAAVTAYGPVTGRRRLP